MESNKKMVLIGGLVLVLIFGVFGTYVHFTKKDIIISSEKKAENTTENNSDNNAKKNNKSGVEEANGDEDTASNVNSKSNSKVSNESSAENEAKDNENEANNEKSTGASESDLEVSYVSYTVLKGDTLTGIWRKNIVSYHCSKASEMIISKNDMSNANDLKPGQKLEIPFIDSKGYTKYSVKQGENLSTIVKKLFPKKNGNEVIQAIKKANGSENVDTVEPDQVLLIPTT